MICLLMHMYYHTCMHMRVRVYMHARMYMHVRKRTVSDMVISFGYKSAADAPKAANCSVTPTHVYILTMLSKL